MGLETHRAGEFAKRTGVMVRTLRCCDQIGLLAPSRHAPVGQRNDWVGKYLTPEQRRVDTEHAAVA